jgi:hypothetical protein
MFEHDLVLRWVMSIKAAEELARLDHFDFALVHFDPDPERAIVFCKNLKGIQPGIRIIFLTKSSVPLPADFCADLFLDSDISEQDLAAHLQSYLRRSA